MKMVSPAHEEGAIVSRSNVLIVDDEEAMRISLEGLLADEFSVSCASNAADAEEHLYKTSFQVIITDHAMPGRSGLDLLRLVHRRHPTMVGILLTGNPSYPEVRAAHNEWRDFRIVLKPYDPEMLLTIVRNAAVFARLRQATMRLGRSLGT
jgi:two-component system response regulator HupR/HoxA